MKFLTFEHNGHEEIGVLNMEKVVPLRYIFNDIGIACPETMNDLIDIWDTELMEDIFCGISNNTDYGILLEKVIIKAPIPFPKRNLFCLGKNYLDHAMETKGLPGGTEEIPKFPIYFSKVADPAIGYGDVILNHSNITDKVDYEVELAVIIGKDGININEEDAEEYIFGYTIVNDVSARNIQRKHGQWFKGKSLESYCPMGPWIVHKSEISFPVELDIKCYINEELRQDSNTNQFIFDIPKIISDLSKGMKLKKGDIIITGTPAGVGLGFKPFKFLKSGDIVKCKIEKIGELVNRFE